MKKTSRQPYTASQNFSEEVNRNFVNCLQQNRAGRRRHATGDKTEDDGYRVRRKPVKRNLLDSFLTQEKNCNML